MTNPIDRLRKTITTQRESIKSLLANDHRDKFNLHVTIAGILRSMLCDRDEPTVIRFFESIGQSPIVWGVFPAEALGSTPPNLVWVPCIVAAIPTDDMYPMRLIELVGAPIGVIPNPDENDPRNPTVWYTACQLIKWTANGEGAAHFNPKRKPSLEEVANGWEITGTLTVYGAHGEITLSDNVDSIIKVQVIQLAQMVIALTDPHFFPEN